MNLQELREVTGVSTFVARIGANRYIKLRKPSSCFEGEWEFYVSKLHGKHLGATREDLETIKEIVNRI